LICYVPAALPQGASHQVASVALGSCQISISPPVVFVTTNLTSAISKEPLFRDIVDRARYLRHVTEEFSKASLSNLVTSPKFEAFARDITALSTRDLQGHTLLKARGTDSDLKCILTGVSRDLPLKLDAIRAAHDETEIASALSKMRDLLSDNIDVIVTPATTNSGLDCTLEFGPDA